MRLSKQIFLNSKTYSEIVKSHETELSALNISGVSESLASMIISNLLNYSVNNAVVVVSTESQARRIFEEIKENSDHNVLYFPKKELMMSHIFTESKDMIWERVSSINKIVFDDEKKIIVVSIESLMYRLMSISDWKKYYIKFNLGESLPFGLLKEKAVGMGYERVDITETPGHFSIRGGIFDVYPPDLEHPIRLEFFGDEIDSIRIFDELTQKSIEKCDSFILTPAVEGCFSKEQVDYLCEELSKNGHDSFVEEIRSGLYREHLDQLLPYLNDNNSTIIDYVNNPDLFFVDLDKVLDRYDHIKEDFIERFKDLLESGEVLAKQSEIIVPKEYLLNKVKRNQIINFNSFSGLNDDVEYDEIISFKMGTVNEYFGKIDLFIKELENFKYRGYRIFVVINDEEKYKLINKVAKEKGFIFDYKEDLEKPLKTSQVAVVRGFLETGFVLLPTKTIVLTEKEIFGTRKKRRIKRFNENSKMLRSFRELKVGDYVVHEGQDRKSVV